MQRKNTYGELINNKFSELVSADMNDTWKTMKEVLDREMPDRKRRWMIWFGANCSIIMIAAFSLVVLAAGTYFGLKRNKQPDNIIAPAENTTQVPQQTLPAENTAETNRPLRHTLTERTDDVNHKERTQPAISHEIDGSEIVAITPSSETGEENNAHTGLLAADYHSKDSITVSETPQTGAANRKRAF